MVEYNKNPTKVKRFQSVNAKIEEVPAYYFKGHWVTVFTPAFTPAVRPLSLRQRQVLDILIDRVRTNNLVRILHADIAEILDVTANAVSKSISALCEHGVIYKHHNYVYEINPNILWFGKRRDYFEPPSNSTPRTHDAVEVFNHGEKATTLHFPHVLTYEQYQRRYGQFQGRRDGEAS